MGQCAHEGLGQRSKHSSQRQADPVIIRLDASSICWLMIHKHMCAKYIVVKCNVHNRISNCSYK